MYAEALALAEQVGDRRLACVALINYEGSITPPLAAEWPARGLGCTQT